MTESIRNNTCLRANYLIQESPILESRCHRRKDQTSQDINDHFCKNWQFKSSKQLEKFCASDLAASSCWAFPTVRDDRIFLVALFFVVFFLIDDLFDDLSFAQGEILTERLILVSKKENASNPDEPLEAFVSDMWRRMRSVDAEAVPYVVQQICLVWKDQVRKDRSGWSDFGSYRDFRAHESGGILATPLLRFGMGIRLSNLHKQAARELEINAARSIAIVNDIYSYQKELRKSQQSPGDMASLCSSVKIISEECIVDTETAIYILRAICRDWEQKHQKLSQEIIARHPELSDYCIAIGYLLSGNEVWSRKAYRYGAEDCI